jgi:RNA polymerase sigma-70 factor (ECF subfamily)
MQTGTTETRASLIMRLPNAADVEAWDEVVAIYSPLIRRLAIRQGMQSADADDLVQIVFAALSRSVEEWIGRGDRGGFRAWLLRIAHNAAVNLLTRRSTRLLAAGGDEGIARLTELPAPNSYVSSQFDVEYRKATFQFAAAKVKQQVSDSTWLAFWKTHVEGEAIAEVAEQLKVSVGTIYVSRSRVMDRLRKAVKLYEVENDIAN